MKIAVYGKVSQKQQVIIDTLLQANWEVIYLEDRKEFNGLEYDFISVDASKYLEDDVWKAMLLSPQPDLNPCWHVKDKTI